MSRPKSSPCDHVGGNVRRCLCSSIYVVVMLPIVAAALLCAGTALAIETASKSLLHGRHKPSSAKVDHGGLQSVQAASR